MGLISYNTKRPEFIGLLFDEEVDVEVAAYYSVQLVRDAIGNPVYVSDVTAQTVGSVEESRDHRDYAIVDSSERQSLFSMQGDMDFLRIDYMLAITFASPEEIGKLVDHLEKVCSESSS